MPRNYGLPFALGRFFMSKKMSGARKIAYTAVFVALSVVANMFSVPLTGSNYLSFTYLVCFLAGIYLGFVPGLAVGFLGDLLGHLLMPYGAYNPFVALSSTLLGVIPALVWRIPKLKRADKLLLATVACAIVCTAGLNTLGLWYFYAKTSKTFWVYLGGRVPFQLIMVAVNYVLTYVVVETKVLDKLILRGDYGEGKGKEPFEKNAVPEEKTIK